ncbi:MAG: general secretion pathway protein GspB [Proteobacteria bacterium]|nr:hypothetical protein [Desulfobulbaceae bacterium]MBU4152349.1 general secretion pathway protein GspB [Pseudomonadota bacterium]
MSYILDAIKKADQKRKLGEVPDVNTIHEAPMAEPRRFGWLYGVAVFLFLNAGGLAWWLWSEMPGPEPAVQVPVPGNLAVVTGQPMPTLSTFQQTDLQPPPANPVATAPPALPPPEAESSFQSRASVPSATNQTISIKQQPVDALPVARADSGASPATSAGLVPVQEEIALLPLPAEEVVSSEDVAASEEEPLVETEEPLFAEGEIDVSVARDQVLVPIATSQGATERVKRAKRVEEDPELAKIPFLKQLPVEVQKSLPVLHISFHSYSIKPSARLVSISGKILRQGEEFDQDLKLDRITVKGVVLDYKGKLFRLDV